MENLIKKISIKGRIRLQSGLHIGGTNSAMDIGGPDKTVIRNPLNNQPYIPGSSLKGKVRSLIELSDGTIGDKAMSKKIRNTPTMDPSHIAAKLFGTATQNEDQRPSRVLFRDGNLLTPVDEFKNTDLPYSESKTEVVIDRITSEAMPRQIERVPAGAEFKLDVVLNIFSPDDQKDLLKHLFRGFKLLSDDYLGGNGSRGSGKVLIMVESVMERGIGFYAGEEEETDLTGEYREEINALMS